MLKKADSAIEYIREKIENLIPREYVDFLYKKIISTKYNYVLYGLRRIGKTTICFQIINKLIKNNVYQIKNLAFIDAQFFLDRGYSQQELKNLILDLVENQNIKILLIDEIQIISRWDSLLKSISDHFPKTKIIATGSSAFKLSLKESGIGRFETIAILPLSLKEFQVFNKNHDYDKLSKQEIINKYILDSPFFELWDIKDSLDKKRYLINLMEKSLLYDILSIDQDINISDCKFILSEIANSISGEISTKSILNKFQISKTTLYRYLETLKNMNLIDSLERKNAKLISIKTGSKKYFLTNPFLYLAYLDFSDKTISFYQGKIYESLLLFHLRYQGLNDIFYIKDKDYNNEEIDFYILDNNSLIELKTQNKTYNKLYFDIKNVATKKTYDINELYDFLIKTKL